MRGTNLVAKYNYLNGAKSEYTYYTQNAHGDVVNLTDESGSVVKSYTYDAFGVEQNIDDSDANAFRYCGEYYDAETGTIYLRARYYNPSIGRFISRDSYVGKKNNPLSLNRYTYCHNNPLIFIDSCGFSAEVIIYHGEGSAWYGHAEIAVNGTIYSYGNYIENDMNGPGILVKTSKDDYLNELNETRQFTMYNLDLTSEEEEGIVDFYESLIEKGTLYDNRSIESGYMKELYQLSGSRGKYRALWRNCSTTVADALKSSISKKRLSYTEKPVWSVPATWYTTSLKTSESVMPSGLANQLSAIGNEESSIVSGAKTYEKNTYKSSSRKYWGPLELFSKNKK